MKKKVQHLEQLLDCAASRLTVYKGADGRLMITEVLGQGGYGRIYSVENLFRYAEQSAKNYEEQNWKEDLQKEFNQKLEKLQLKIDSQERMISDLLSYAERTPRFGWKS